MATALQPVEVSCPVCGGGMYDNRATKKNPKQPDFKCKRYKEGCEGVIWPPKANRTAKAAPFPSSTVASNVPNQQLPPLLQNAEAEDAKELADRIGSGKPKMREAYKSLTEWVIAEIAPLYVKADYGISPEGMAACVQTLFIQACKAGKVE